MERDDRTIFFLNGKKDNWETGKQKKIWGLPVGSHTIQDGFACLQGLGFRAGAEVVAISGPFAHIRAVIGSHRGVYYDVTPLWIFGPRNETYPIRIELTEIQEINSDWYKGLQGGEYKDDWRFSLKDVYLSMKSLYILDPNKNKNDPYVNYNLLFTKGPSYINIGDSNDPCKVLEDDTAKAFYQLGFRVDQLGYKKPLERLPDGIGFLSPSLINYARQLNKNPYFLIWDCKYDCSIPGLKAADERAIREYIEFFAQSKKIDAQAGEFWFLIIAQNKAVADKINQAVSQWFWTTEYFRFGLRGLRVMSLQSIKNLIERRRASIDLDAFLMDILPREFAKSYLV